MFISDNVGDPDKRMMMMFIIDNVGNHYKSGGEDDINENDPLFS